ncbi:phospho-N-acetylmuramoyl-pentapeptide-transferase [Alphaproteobacteria bacterium]|nr:phospho-N-acetylmuramoyl-pentapeptide-transferase [Alphaproteobacteria bacterium]
MLPDFLLNFTEYFQPLNLFKYITFRTIGALLTALLISFIFGSKIISLLKKMQKQGQPIRKDGPKNHIIFKTGTPTMGGLLILFAFTTSTLLWARLDNIYIWILLFVAISFGFIGLLDDWLKVSKMNSKGLKSYQKILPQIFIAFIAAWFLAENSPANLNNSISIPFLKESILFLGIFYIPFTIIVIVGSSNAVNLTDGLDGLAIVPVMIAASSLAIIAYLVGNINFSNYLQINYIPGVGEISVFLGAIIGAGLGFLWFNAPPAMVFMGDTGSLSLGGVIGVTASASRHELVLVIIGGVFVLETISVIVQILSFKLTGKRIFRMAPLHHHFEQKGWAESTIVIRFWIIAVVLALIGLSTLKLR